MKNYVMLEEEYDEGYQGFTAPVNIPVSEIITLVNRVSNLLQTDIRVVGIRDCTVTHSILYHYIGRCITKVNGVLEIVPCIYSPYVGVRMVMLDTLPDSVAIIDPGGEYYPTYLGTIQDKVLMLTEPNTPRYLVQEGEYYETGLDQMLIQIVELIDYYLTDIGINREECLFTNGYRRWDYSDLPYKWVKCHIGGE